MNVDINILAIVLAALLGMVIGYAWYAPFGFGKLWAKYAKIDLSKSNYGAIILASLSMIALAYGLAVAAKLAALVTGWPFFYSAVSAGLFIWMCFQALRMLQRAQFNRDAYPETVIHIGNEFITVVSMAAIIGLIGI